LKLVDSMGLVGNAATVGPYLRDGLATALADSSIVGDVRGEGLLAAVEFVADRADRRFFDPALKVGAQVATALASRGVIGRAMPQGDILGFAPPLCLSKAEADMIVEATADSVAQVAKSL